MSFDHSLVSCHAPKVRALLKNAVGVGASVAITKDRDGICIGFAEKYIHRGGFDHKHAGVYIDFATAIVKPSDGGPNVLVPLNLGSAPEIADINIRIANLPETPFWEGDVVRHKSPSNENWMVEAIDYAAIHSVAGCFKLATIDGRTHMKKNGGFLRLVSRGNLWKMEHGGKMEFASIEDEARFYQSLGLSQKLAHDERLGFVGEGVRNTEVWKMIDAIACIRRGDGDEMKIKDKQHMLFVVIKYDNKEFSERMRAHTLAKFDLAD